MASERRSSTYCSSEEWPQAEIDHCSSCHREWDDYDEGVIDCDHRMEADLKDRRLLVYCCQSHGWFEQKGLLT